MSQLNITQLLGIFHLQQIWEGDVKQIPKKGHQSQPWYHTFFGPKFSKATHPVAPTAQSWCQWTWGSRMANHLNCHVQIVDYWISCLYMFIYICLYTYVYIQYICSYMFTYIYMFRYVHACSHMFIYMLVY